MFDRIHSLINYFQEIKSNWKVKGAKKLSNKFIKLKKAAQERKVSLFFLASSLKKRKKNLSFYDFKNDSITWHVQMNFPNADFKTYVKINENTKLIDSIQTVIDAQEDNKQMEFYKAHGLSKLRVLLKAEGLKRNQNRYYDLNAKKSLKSCLRGKVVIEYPSISVLMDHCIDGYDLIMSDGKKIIPQRLLLMFDSEEMKFLFTFQMNPFKMNRNSS